MVTKGFYFFLYYGNPFISRKHPYLLLGPYSILLFIKKILSVLKKLKITKPSYFL